MQIIPEKDKEEEDNDLIFDGRETVVRKNDIGDYNFENNIINNIKLKNYSNLLIKNTKLTKKTLHQITQQIKTQ